MKSIGLTLKRTELQNAFKTLSVIRCRKASPNVPGWLFFDTETKKLQIVEEDGTVAAYVVAEGEWPAAGATIDLMTLKRALGHCKADAIQIHALEDAVLLSGGKWYVKMNLLKFGPDSVIPATADNLPTLPPGGPPPLTDLPLFRWARRH